MALHPYQCVRACVHEYAYVCVCVCINLPHLLRAKKAPADALSLLCWTLEAVDRYFKALGRRQLWLPRDKAIACVRSCQQFTVAWLEVQGVLSQLHAHCSHCSVHCSHCSVCMHDRLIGNSIGFLHALRKATVH